MNLDKVVSNLAGSGLLGGFAGGAVGGALVSNKKARKVAGTALKVGGLAALGGMAWKAYQGYNTERGKVPTAVPSGTQPQIDESAWSGISEQRFSIDARESHEGSRALFLIQAMIAAACADGHVDPNERKLIMSRAREAGMSAEERAMVFDSMQSPLSLSQLSERVDCPELAAEVYMASLLAVDRTGIEAELYLDALAFRLGIPEALVAKMHDELPAPALEVA